ncbi:unnamed protein product [Strongylus vulgaris]|uniref:Uncharacterized protein n=1 Tax=Strongylus vulgaris TaxID=40348 RepID=A0A3P7I2C8_STRVU|nr:unnamed protein product [Strongylus vulgaris]
MPCGPLTFFDSLSGATSGVYPKYSPVKFEATKAPR